MLGNKHFPVVKVAVSAEMKKGPLGMCKMEPWFLSWFLSLNFERPKEGGNE